MNDLTNYMNLYGSDKGSGHHNYTEYYSKIFSNYRFRKFDFLEIGIGSVRPDIPSSMIGTPGGYIPGSSIKAWRDYFPNAQIYGCDIDDTIMFQDTRIETFQVDQTKPQSVIENIVNRGKVFGIIIDDGLHHFKTNWNVLKLLYNNLDNGGIYVIEDICDYNENIILNDPFLDKLNRNGDKIFYVPLPNERNEIDNNLLILQKDAKV